MWYSIITAPTKNYSIFAIVAAILSSLGKEGKCKKFHIENDAEFLFEMTSQLLNSLGSENLNKPIEELFECLPNYKIEIEPCQKIQLAFQVHLFHFKTGNYVQSIPSEFNSKLRQIYFAIEKCENLIKYLYPIFSLNVFFERFGKFCFYCKRTFTSRGCNHKCSKVTNCFSCKRPFKQIDTFVTSETASFFCTGSLSPSFTQKCPKCNILYYSQECFNEHKKKVCCWGWKCPKCEIYQGRNGFFKTQDEIKSKHICGQRNCNFCGEKRDKQHLCTLKEYKHQNEFTNLAFVSFAYSGFNISKCFECYMKNDKKPCSFCPTMQEKPISCIVFQEELNRKSFSSLILNDPTFQSKLFEPVSKQQSFLEYSYIPSFVHQSPKLSPEGRKTRFGKRETQKRKCNDAFSKTTMTFMDIFLTF